MKRLLVIQVAALGHEFLRDSGAPRFEGLEFQPAQSVFPAVTCTVQASFRTAAAPASHGMIANGVYARQLRRPMFWEQSAGLVHGPRIWDGFRSRGGTVGLLFWQQSLGEAADVILSPAPIHKHHGGMIQDCYSRPADLYARLCREVGGPFRLRHYWGPLASAKAGDWIASATAAVLTGPAAPDLLLTYLPTLDYNLQRWGPGHAKAADAIARLGGQLGPLVRAARAKDYEVIVLGDYAIAATPGGAVFPNRALREAGLMSVRDIAGRLYPDFHTSRAFAVVDHEIAHVYVKNPADLPAARRALEATPGVAEVLDRPAQAGIGLDHANSGELVLVAREGNWLAYPWWTDKRQAPDYASHVDIHNKPGYDPCELFFGWPPMSVSQDTGRIKGSHGRVGAGREVAWASTIPLGNGDRPRPGRVQSPFPSPPRTLLELASAVKDWLDA